MEDFRNKELKRFKQLLLQYIIVSVHNLSIKHCYRYVSVVKTMAEYTKGLALAMISGIRLFCSQISGDDPIFHYRI